MNDDRITQDLFLMNVQTFTLFIISFVIGTALPSFIVPFIVSRFFFYKKIKKEERKYFVLSLLSFGLLVSLIWQLFIRGNVYTHWDSYTLGYTYLFHEAPEIGFGPDIYANNWSSQSLEFLWMLFTFIAYVLSAISFVMRYKTKKHLFFSVTVVILMFLLSVLFIPTILSLLI